MKKEKQEILIIGYARVYKEPLYSINGKFGFELENAKEKSRKGGHAQ